jgi:hypothetical protein
MMRHSIDKVKPQIKALRRSAKFEGHHRNKALLEESESDDGWRDQDVFLASEDGDSAGVGAEDEGDDSDDDSDSSDEGSGEGDEEEAAEEPAEVEEVAPVVEEGK